MVVNPRRPRLNVRNNILLALAVFGVCERALGDSTASIELTEDELRGFDGTDTAKPIYVGIDGKLFDVSASPAFYGPGGHYHHFAGKDASRAWVTECWDEPEQLTWRMDGIEAMFMPKYLDEQMQDTAAGEDGPEGSKEYGAEEMQQMAIKAISKLGKVSKKEKKARRKRDRKEAKEKLNDALNHWVGFFEGNDKYRLVGSVLHDKDKPEPPAVCAAALKKRPLKGGKLEKMMGSTMGMGPPKMDTAQIPDFVKKHVLNKDGDGEGASADAGADDYHATNPHANANLQDAMNFGADNEDKSEL